MRKKFIFILKKKKKDNYGDQFRSTAPSYVRFSPFTGMNLQTASNVSTLKIFSLYLK